MTPAAFERRYAAIRRRLDAGLRAAVKQGAPRELTDGCRYVLAAGGKRLRAAVLLLSCEAVGGSSRQALDAGMAVETMHNFTLVHDDIMDNAATRRGRPTVHTRWDVNNALLVGDVLLGVSYRMLLKTAGREPRRLAGLLTRGLLDVCEGQALDLEFAHRSDVTVNEYFRMIEKKTGRLFETAAELGAVIGGGSPREVNALRTFGRHLGRAFQLQDDLLDVMADGRTFGKSIGGDIVERKRTFLLLRAAERARGEDAAFLRRMLDPERHDLPGSREELVARVKQIYRRYGVLDEAQALIRKSTALSIRSLARLRTNTATEMLRWLSGALMTRNS